MSDPLGPAAALPPKENPEALVLRGTPRPAVRFRRGLIVGLTGAAAAGLITLSWLALQPPSFRGAIAPLDRDEPVRKESPDALANVPGSYGDVPRLGPPLPGDLGRPIREQQKELAASSVASPDGISAAEAERGRLAPAREAARSSAVLVQLEGGRSGTAAATPATAPPDEITSAPSPQASPASQQHKLDFERSSDGDPSPHELRAAPSPWTLSAGTIIPASLITGLNSDLPGTVIAQVTENVSDSMTGRTILVPQGARLIGSYDSVVAYGQRRVLVVWNHIVLPDGSAVQLDNLPATDASGYAGVQDGVDSHGWQLLKGIALSTLFGVGTQLSLGGGSDLARAIRESAQQNAAHAGDRITSRNLDVQPTITVRPGWPVRALVNKDLVLQPWRE